MDCAELDVSSYFLNSIIDEFDAANQPDDVSIGPIILAALDREEAKWKQINKPTVYARKPSGGVISWGKYKGWTIGAIKEHDPRYAIWLKTKAEYVHADIRDQL